MIIIKKLLMIVLFLIPIFISSFKETTFFKPHIIVYLNDKDLYLDLEDYIIGVVAGEMPASFETDALKAQAVASRSYALSKMENNFVSISSSINDQVYLTNYELKNKWNNDYHKYYEKIKEAVNDTNNEVVTRDGKILKTYYFSMSNGYTENSNTVFKENTFVSVESPLEKILSNFEVTKTISEQELLDLLNLQKFTIDKISHNNTNHVDKIVISGKEYSGIDIRKKLGLRSTDFTFKKNGTNYDITTKGYGHGVGMSQYGANLMAKNGSTYQEILNYYYQNTNLTSL